MKSFPRDNHHLVQIMIENKADQAMVLAESENEKIAMREDEKCQNEQQELMFKTM